MVWLVLGLFGILALLDIMETLVERRVQRKKRVHDHKALFSRQDSQQLFWWDDINTNTLLNDPDH